ncbi:MAG TPA: hypothetical protein VNL70_03565 [Tepidisphaeraceae bacterium]|nr:hypothetical protein [Tepidisphaeraceae bacterium]
MPLLLLAASSSSVAAPTQEEVLRSISKSVGQPVDPGRFLIALFAIGGLIVVAAFISQRRKRVIAPRVLNHPGKLLKEVSRRVGLKPAELRHLRRLAEVDEQVSNPLTLLLCPSLLEAAMKRNAHLVDRRVIAGLLRRLRS